MNVVVTLAPESQQTKPAVGDFARFQIFADATLGSPSDHWVVEAPEGATWMASGSVTLSLASLKALPADGNATKIELAGLVHQPGPLSLGALVLRNETTKQELIVPATTISGADVPAPAALPQGKTEVPWLLPPVPFGSWNWPMVALLAALLFGVFYFVMRRFMRRFRGHRRLKLSHTELALNDIANLQKYAKAKKPLQQEEWKKFSFELADILRKYSDSNWFIDSRDMTDRELLAELRLHSTAAPQVDLLSQVLTTITEVRYGRKELDASVVPGLLLEARRFVESTTPKPKEGSAT